MAGPRPRRNRHDIETQGSFGKDGVAPDIELGGPADALAGLRRHRLKSSCQVAAPLDLDKSNDAAPTGNQIDLTHLGTIAPGENAIAAEHQAEGSQALTRMAAPISGATARFGPRRGHAQPFRLANGTTLAESGWIGSSGKMKRQ
jgi:hypothetical protein